jgi:MurNAc alpha-1-phosphate uridylyltransferase
MILAAGRGDRMRPLTDTNPNPLVAIGGKPMIEYPLRALARAGVHDVVVNIAYRGRQIVDHLATLGDLGLNLVFSDEGATALETGGGIRHALPLLDAGPFAVVNGDIFTDYPFERLLERAAAMPGEVLAHLVLVENPPHRPQGDFALDDGRVNAESVGTSLTFSGIGLYRAALFEGMPDRAFPLAPLLRSAMAERRVTGEHYGGVWHDVGTPQRLAEIEARLAARRENSQARFGSSTG